jgi:glucose/arabinose dehydrogenase/PKD repeat protein
MLHLSQNLRVGKARHFVVFPRGGNKLNAARLKRNIPLQVWLVLVAATLATCLLAMVSVEPAEAAALPPSFEDQKVTALPDPIDLAFTPDGRLLVASQGGTLRVYKNGQLLQTPALDLASATKICTTGEHGLSGVTVDPNFSTNHYVYLFYTFNKSGGTCPTGEQWDPTDPNQPVNRVSRFVMSGEAIDPASQKVLIDNIPTGNNHQGGGLGFGKDGYLYISVGDGLCDYMGDSGCAGQNDASRDKGVLLGKMLRITREGSIPSVNPYQGADSARCNLTGKTDPSKYCQETFASGLRNPFRFAFDPGASGTRLFINDVGGNAWEEVDLGTARADYGWNLCEGNHDGPSTIPPGDCTAAPYTPPIHEYSHTTGCAAATGGAFVPTAASWPASYDSSYLFGDYVCNKIFELKPKSGGGYAASEFATGLGQGGPVSMGFGPGGSGQALYYTTYANGGEVHRISYTGTTNSAPTAVASATPTSGAVPLNVSFDGGGSSDPDGNTLTYAWNFGDGTTGTGPTTTHTYQSAGTYTATLTVRDGNGGQDSASVRIDAGNTPPQPTIDLPSASKLFRVGEQITLRGGATDTQDGQLPNSALSWEVRQWHNGSHYHPFLSDTGNDLTLAAPAPEDLAATGAGNYLEIRLTATDSDGLSKTVVQELQPHRVDVTLASQPSGLSLQANGEAFAAPKTLVSWEGYKLNVYAPSPQTSAGTPYLFGSWSDGGAQRHDVTTEAQPSTYAATFKACTIGGTPGNDTLNGTSGSDFICGLGGDDTIYAQGGNDTIEGMGGNDTARGGSGADQVKGGPDADSLYGGDGNDSLNSKDRVNGNDSLDGGAGTDTKVTDATEKSILRFP